MFWPGLAAKPAGTRSGTSSYSLIVTRCGPRGAEALRAAGNRNAGRVAAGGGKHGQQVPRLQGAQAVGRAATHMPKVHARGRRDQSCPGHTARMVAPCGGLCATIRQIGPFGIMFPVGVPRHRVRRQDGFACRSVRLQPAASGPLCARSWPLGVGPGRLCSESRRCSEKRRSPSGGGAPGKLGREHPGEGEGPSRQEEAGGGSGEGNFQGGWTLSRFPLRFAGFRPRRPVRLLPSR